MQVILSERKTYKLESLRQLPWINNLLLLLTRSTSQIWHLRIYNWICNLEKPFVMVRMADCVQTGTCIWDVVPRLTYYRLLSCDCKSVVYT
jgi:hypothetical protein